MKKPDLRQPQPPRKVTSLGIKCYICLDFKPASDMRGKGSICRECAYDPQMGCVIAERKFGDYVPVIKRAIPDGMKQCKGCEDILPEAKFITKAGKESPSCDKCRMAWFKDHKAQGNYY